MSTDVSEVRAASIITYSSLMVEAAHTSGTSVDNYFIRQYIPEDNSELHTRRRENLKSHMIFLPETLHLTLVNTIVVMAHSS
jgi:hypothetical protein